MCAIIKGSRALEPTAACVRVMCIQLDVRMKTIALCSHSREVESVSLYLAGVLCTQMEKNKNKKTAA